MLFKKCLKFAPFFISWQNILIVLKNEFSQFLKGYVHSSAKDRLSCPDIGTIMLRVFFVLELFIVSIEPFLAARKINRKNLINSYKLDKHHNSISGHCLAAATKLGFLP